MGSSPIRPARDHCSGSAKSFAGKRLRFDAILAEAKAQVINSSFVADLDRLAVQFQRLAPRFTADELRARCGGIAIRFPLYRSYVSTAGAAPEDRRLIDKRGGRGARPASGAVGRAVYSFLRRALKGEAAAGLGP